MSIIRNSFHIYKKSKLLIIVFALICFIIPSVSSAAIVPELLGAGFEGPFGIVYDASGNLLVTNENDVGADGSSYISSIAPDGTISIFSSGFTGASGLAYDSSGTLFASDDTDQIYQIDSIGDWTVVVTGGVGLLNPNAIAFDASDNLYVLNAGGFVSKFDSSGGLIDIALAGGFNVPQGIVVDDADGLLYVADAGGRIYQVDMYNGETNLWLETGYDSNGGFTMDSQRNFFLSSPGSGSVIRIDRNDMSVSVCVTGYDHPRGLLFDGLGRLIFTEYNPGNVFRIDECDEFIQPFNATFTASITNNWIDLREFSPDALVEINIYDAVGGNLLFSEFHPTDGNGGVWLDGEDHNIDLVPGMYIVITDEDVLLAKDLVLEPISVTIFDIDNDLMEGTAPAEVGLWVDAGNEFDGYGLDVLSDASGNWSADFSSTFDITDDMGGAVHLYDEDGDDTLAEPVQPPNPPSFTVSITSNWMDMREFSPDGSVVVEIYAEVDGNLLFSESRPTDGNGGVWLDGGEHNIDLVPGMHIVITDETTFTDKDLVLQDISLDIFDIVSDTMQGTAPTEVGLWVDAGNEFAGYGLGVVSDASGFWYADFSSVLDITDDMGGAVHLYDEDGDDTVADYWPPEPPSMTVQPDHGWISTRNWENNTLLTIYIDDNDDLVDDYLWEGDFVTEEMDGDPNNVGVHAELWPFIDLSPGQYVTISSDTQNVQYQIEYITYDYLDEENDVSGGNGPAGKNGGAWIDSDSGGHWMEVEFLGDGSWIADFGAQGFDIVSPLFDVFVEVYDDFGNATMAHWEIVQLPSFSASITSEWLEINNFSPDASVTIDIYESNGGSLLFSEPRGTNEDGQAWLDGGEHGIDLLPGIFIVVTDDVTLLAKELEIQSLSLDVFDINNDIIEGSAPAESWLWVDAGNQFDGFGMEIQSDTFGFWSVDFGSEGFDITGDMGGSVHLSDEDGDETIAEPESPDSGECCQTWSVVLGDLNGNGYLDLIYGYDHAPNEVWFNDGFGQFSNSGQELENLDSREVKIADFDGDGDLDLYVANQFGDPNTIWINDGNGNFNNSGQMLGFEDSVDMALGDLDGDGDIDAFITNSENVRDEVWFNDGSGNFTSSGQNIGSSSSEGVYLGDVDNDGDMDAFVTNYHNEPNQVWLNDGSGTFSDSGQLFGSADSGVVILADLDGDFDLDAFIGNNGPNKVYLNNGNGFFVDSGQNLGNLDTWALDIGDLDGDGDLDVFVGAANGPNQVWLNDGTGNFTNTNQNIGNSSSWSVKLGDLDVDGDLDAAVANHGDNTFWCNDGAGNFFDCDQIPPPVINPTTEVVVPPGEFIQLSVVVDLSGPVFQSGIIGPMDAVAVQMAIEDFGLIHGFAILQITFDGECSQVGGNTVSSIIATDANNVGVIGHNCSNSTIEGLPLYEQAGMVLISGSATNGALPDVGPSVFNRTILQDGDFWDVDPTSLASYINWEVEYSSRFGNNPGPFSAYFYDAASLLLTRLFETSILDQSGDLVINRAVLAGAVRNTDGYLGVTGCIVLDEVGNRVAYDTSVNCNMFPIADASGPYEGDEGSPIYLDGSASYDPDGGSLTYEWDLDNDGTFETSGMNVEVTFDDNDTFLVGLLVTDNLGGTDTTGAEIIINNVSPDVGEIAAPVYPVQINTEILVSASFFDPGADSWTAIWDWGDNSTSEGTIAEFNVDGNHVFDAPGVYTLTLTVVDDDGGVGVSVYQYLVIYDPNGGFVTGGGWIWSPQGAYAGDTSLEGNARFGFVAKYKKGANTPTGITQFQFKVGDLNFHSTEYDWLVVAGARAQFKGVGTINGEGEYGFMLTVIDGEINGGGGVDKFRIKIWSIETGEIVYDNQMGELEDVAPAIEIVSGSIVVHKK